MIFDDDKPDYFLGDDDPDSGELAAGTQPALTSGTTIDFTQQVAQDSSGTAPRHPKVRRWLVYAVVVAVAVLGVAFYFRYCSPYAVDARLRVTVVNVEKRGLLMKTYEADAVSVDAITDTSATYSHDYSFSVVDEDVVESLRQAQLDRRPVTVCYERYYATLPWRGASRLIVTAVIP